jgi:hypothetical protein
MKRLVRCMYAAVFLASCNAKVGDGLLLGGETHFLVTCGEDCGPGLACIGGVCTRGCEPGYSSCSELASQAECASSADDAAGRGGFAGSCDVLCSGDVDCAALGEGYFCTSGACRAEPEARQAALASPRPRLTLARAVAIDTCLSGLRWVGGDTPSAEMHPGSDCVGCHRETGARSLMLGGTVYAQGAPLGPEPLADCFGLEGIVVHVTDGDGNERSTVTNRAGNFYFEGKESELVLPYSADIDWNLRGRPTQTFMVTQAFYGGCARCHAEGLSYAPPRLDLDPDLGFDPESVIPAGGVIQTPGLYPRR